MRRFIPRFSLRTVIAVLLTIGTLLGVLSNRTQQQKSTIAWVSKNGGRIGYDYHWHGRGAFGIPIAPKWITNILGLDLFASVHDVDFENTDIEIIDPLTQLPHLERIWLNDTNVADINALSNLRNLIEINVGGTQVSDFTPLKDHNELLWLTIPDEISDTKMKVIRKMIPNCDVRRPSDPN